MSKPLTVLTCLILLFGTVAGCGTSRATGYTLVQAGPLKPGASIPPPTGPVVLSLTGKIAVKNAGDRLDLDLPALEQFDLIEYATNDTAIRRRAVYRGVLLKDVLTIAGADPNAVELRAWALDDYETIIPLSVLQWPVMLATFRDGQRMTVRDKGPIEIVFPYEGFDIDPARYDPMWVWSLRTLDVR